MQSVTSNAVAQESAGIRSGSYMMTLCSRGALGDYNVHWLKLFSFTMGRQYSTADCVFDIIVHSVNRGTHISGYWCGYTQVVSDPYVWNEAGTIGGSKLYYGKTVNADGTVTIDIWVPTFSDNYVWHLVNVRCNTIVTIYTWPSQTTDVSGLTAFN